MKRLISVLSFIALWPLTPTWAQLYPPNETGVSMGHWGTIVRDVDAAKKFWIVLGAKPIKIDETDVMELPGVLIFLTPGTPIGGNEETALGHFGFGVPSVQKAFEKFKAAGLKIREPRKSPLNGQDMGNVFTLDNLNVEITEEAGVAPYPVIAPNLTIESTHAHFFVPESSQKEIADWYIKRSALSPGAAATS